MNRKENYSKLPEIVKTFTNWVVQRAKKPLDPRTGYGAKANDPTTWTDFETAVAAVDDYDGLGFEITPPFLFVDLDDAMDANSGEPKEWAAAIITRLNSYTEVSVSGKGIHVLCRTTQPLPPNGRKHEISDSERIEVYDSRRYFAMTGNHLAGTATEIEDRTEELLALHEEFFPSTKKEPKTVLPTPTASDEAIIAACRAARNAAKFVKLFDNGDISDYAGNESNADGALLAIMGYRTRDPEQIDRLFRQSALLRPKWDEKRGSSTYGQVAIEGAIKFQMAVPSGFAVKDEGVYFQPAASEDDEESPPIFLCSKLEIVAATRNSEGGEWGRSLRWCDPEMREHSWAMPMSMLAGDGGEILAELLAGGLSISPNRKSRELFKTYLQSTVPAVLMKSVSRVGWHDDTYVFPDSTVGGNEDGEAVVFQSSGIEHQFKVSGSLEDWKEHVAKYCIGNSRLAFAVSMAFAAPILQLIDCESGGFQFVGPSSMGKSTTLRVAASVNGGKNYVRSWRSTANGLEGVASLHNDALLILDEIGQANPKEVGEVTYMLANGQGKVRMARAGGTRKPLQWRLLFLSSGEVGLRDHMLSSGIKVRGGQEVRCLDIDSDAGKGFGLFDTLHGCADGAAFADSLTKASYRYHGVAGRTFVAKIAPHRDKTRLWVLNQIKDFVEDQSRNLKNASGEVHRALFRFALVGVAGELATNLKITGWSEGEAKRSAAICFRAWLSRRGSSGASDVEAGLRQVKAFLERHGSSRFQLKKSPFADGTSTVSNRAGFRDKAKDNEYLYYILPEVFQGEVCAGYDYRLIAKELAKRGHLEHDHGRLTKKTRLPEVGNANAYVILPSLLSEPELVLVATLPIAV